MWWGLGHECEAAGGMLLTLVGRLVSFMIDICKKNWGGGVGVCVWGGVVGRMGGEENRRGMEGR